MYACRARLGSAVRKLDYPSSCRASPLDTLGRAQFVAKKESGSYDGILARPIEDMLLLPNTFGDSPPSWFLELGGSFEQWKPFPKAAAERLLKVEFEVQARMNALCDHF